MNNSKVFFFLLFLILIIYGLSLGNGWVADDFPSIVNNPLIDSFGYFWRPPYFNIGPVNFVFFSVHKLFDFIPAFYRLPNILFHFGSAYLIYLILQKFFTKPVPFLTTVIFAVHPLLSEPVVWITGAGYAYGAFFALLALYLYLRYCDIKILRYYYFSIFAFYLSLCSSEKLIGFPLILFLYEFCFGDLKNHWKKLLPFFCISGLWGILLAGLMGVRIDALATVHYQQTGLMNPLLQIPIAITSYLQLIFWPHNLALYHSELTFNQTEYLIRLGVFLSFLGLIGYFFKTNKKIFFWFCFFFFALLPTLTPFGISWIVAERYVYLASLGIFVFAALIFNKFMEKIKQPKIAYGIFAMIIFALSARTFIRTRDWQSQDTLWLAMEKTSPSSAQNHNNLGDMYGRRNDHQRAITEFKKAIELLPNYGDAYHNLANTYYQINETDLAIENYQKAISFNPLLWQSRQNLAGIYFHQEKYSQAREEIAKALETNPKNPNLYQNLAAVCLKLQDQSCVSSANQQIEILSRNLSP